jgi:thiosulfate dehydrogenase [quinone] large subunit
MNTKKGKQASSSVLAFNDSPVSRFLFSDVRFAWVWLILRLYAGYEWLAAGWEKLHSTGWVGSTAGTALTGFVKGALTETTGAHPAVEGWYAAFLQSFVLPNAGVWSFIVSWGEFLVGIALILGIFTGIAAFFGGFMNVNYLFAGSVSSNPLLFVLATWIVLAWKTAGWWGLDRWVLPALGTPWSPGRIFRETGGGSHMATGPSKA